MPFDNAALPSTDVALLTTARDKIASPWLWAKCRFTHERRMRRSHRPAVQYCAVAAVSAACANESFRPTKQERDLCRLLVRELPHHGGVLLQWFTSAHFRVRIFNDHPMTVHADVLAMFDRAIARANDK